MGAPSEGHAELLRRLAATGRSDRELEAAIPLPQAFLAKARRGGNDSTRAEASWERIRGHLDGGPVAPAPSSSPAPAAPSQQQVDRDRERASLVVAQQKARGLDDLGMLLGLVFRGITEGWISGSESNRYVMMIEQQRKIEATRLENEARKAAAAPQVIEVVYLADWRPAAG